MLYYRFSINLTNFFLNRFPQNLYQPLLIIIMLEITELSGLNTTQQKTYLNFYLSVGRKVIKTFSPFSLVQKLTGGNLENVVCKCTHAQTDLTHPKEEDA